MQRDAIHDAVECMARMTNGLLTPHSPHAERGRGVTRPWNTFLWLQHQLDSNVMLVAERLVHLWTALKTDGVGDHDARIDLALLDPVQEIVGPAVHMPLPLPHGQALVHQRPE